jgi:3-oxoacyl-[acyl-carrier-protein] synthase-1
MTHLKGTDMANIKLVISGIGMISSVGISASQTCASLSAGITRKTSMPEIYYCRADDPDFEDGTELIAAPVSFLKPMREQYPEPAKWLACIGEKAFSDLMESSIYSDERDSETGLFISLPPQLNDADPKIKDEFIYHFHNRIEKDLFPVETYCFEGHTGVFTMIDAARNAISEGKITSAIVGCVESCLFPDWLDELDRDYRIKSPRNIDGYTPGEAAAFLWLAKESQAPKDNDVTFTIDDLASDTGLNPSPGASLKNVVAGLLNDTDETKVIFCDLNGESKRMEEWGFVRTSLGERLGNPVHVEHPADVLGDIGASTGAALIIAAMYHLQIMNKDCHTALIWTASDNGERRAVIVRKTRIENI